MYITHVCSAYYGREKYDSQHQVTNKKHKPRWYQSVQVHCICYLKKLIKKYNRYNV